MPAKIRSRRFVCLAQADKRKGILKRIFNSNVNGKINSVYFSSSHLMVHGSEQISMPEIRAAVGEVDWEPVHRTLIGSVIREKGPFQEAEWPVICNHLKNRQALITNIETGRNSQSSVKTATIQALTGELEAIKAQKNELADQLETARVENTKLMEQLRSIAEALERCEHRCSAHKDYSDKLKESTKKALTEFYDMFRMVLPSALPRDITEITQDSTNSSFLNAVYSACIELRGQLEQFIEKSNLLEDFHATASQVIQHQKTENLSLKAEILNFKAEQRFRRHANCERVHFSWSRGGRMGPCPR